MKNLIEIKNSSILENEHVFELSQDELLKTNGGDGYTRAFFYGLGYFCQAVSDGFASARSGSRGAYVPNM